MRISPVFGVIATTVLAFAQLGVVCAISGVVAQLDGLFSIHPGLDVLTTCALSMGTKGACTYSYVSTAVGIILSLLLVGLTCASIEGRSSTGFCGPMLSFVGFVYFAIYAGITTMTAISADRLSSEGHGLRQATVGLGWSAAALYALTFFLSAATAKSTIKVDSRSTLARTLTRAKYMQPAGSEAGSPKKAWAPVEQGSPKKWRQPPNTHNSFVVTSNGVRTLVVVAGTPTALSRQTTLSALSAGGSMAGSAPGSPTKIYIDGNRISAPNSPTKLAAYANVPLPHGFFGQAAASPTAALLPAQHTFSHAGAAGLPHSASQPVMRTTSSVTGTGLARGHSSIPPALVRGHSTASGGHRLAVSSGAGSGSTTPRDPTARV